MYGFLKLNFLSIKFFNNWITDVDSGNYHIGPENVY